jgi:AcrR family transcriptional regulator
MGYTKENVVNTAIAILDNQGLPGLTMRRLATTLGVQQSALYWHFESKQLLLAAMAEEVLRRGRQPDQIGAWDSVVSASAEALRDTLLAYRDGAELVSTVYAFGLGADQPHRRFTALIASAGASEADADVAATVLFQFVLGFTFSEQQQLHASSAGAIEGTSPPKHAVKRSVEPHPFRAGVALILDGIRAREPQRMRP